MGYPAIRRRRTGSGICYDGHYRNEARGETGLGMWVIAHRGASAFAPENTLAALQAARELGADFVEVDLQLSRDARLVAIHDPTLGRTTDGHGAVSGKTLEELRLLDAGAWFDGKAAEGGLPGFAGKSFAGQRIPTIQEILEFGAQYEVGLYLELKPRGPTGIEHAIVGALRTANEILRSVVLLSFDLTTLTQLRRLEPLLVTGYLCTETAGSVASAVNAGARQLLPRADRITPELLAEAHRSDLKVVAWTVDDPTRMKELIAAGIDGIITNYPNRLVQLVGERPARQTR
jgi:glycerophosphoryl diester phosphodiesterase